MDSLMPRQMSVLQSLPNEILAKIFVWGTVLWWHNSRTKLPFPMTVGGVCTHWRVLSHGTPELWKRIFVPFLRVVLVPCCGYQNG
ncbi:hypothetical protein BDQ17DRAFT_1042585 [Cyathus striatus]|nr:hypothetical protein BDQ17DRAFT_1042585 [Cyathus striatus]